MSSFAVVKGITYVQETVGFCLLICIVLIYLVFIFTHDSENTRNGVVNSYYNSIFQWLLLIVKTLCKISKMYGWLLSVSIIYKHANTVLFKLCLFPMANLIVLIGNVGV